MRIVALLLALGVGTARAETDLFVGGIYCGRLHQLAWKKRQVHALDCEATTALTAEPATESGSKLYVSGRFVGYTCDLAAPGRDLSGLSCRLRFGEPGQATLPSPTPTARRFSLVDDWVVPPAHAAHYSISGADE